MTQTYLRPTQARCLAGFSLIELLIVIAIIGILAAFAYPSYTTHLKRVARTDAQSSLLDLSSRMERYYADQNTYLGATVRLNPGLTPLGHYIVTIAETAESYVLSATPQGSQIDDECGIYSIDSLGSKGATLDAMLCW